MRSIKNGLTSHSMREKYNFFTSTLQVNIQGEIIEQFHSS